MVEIRHLMLFFVPLLLMPLQPVSKIQHAENDLRLAGPLPYDLDVPDSVIKLPRRLNEISGLSVIDSTRIVAIQDEKGIIYVLNARTGEVVHELRFGDDADYEGIERAGDILFVLRSDGDLFAVNMSNLDSKKRGKARRIRTRLSARYDTEGLAYDAQSNRLLIACKEYAGKGLKKKRSIFAFDLASEKVGSEPEYVISIEQIERAVPDGNISFARFKPSALALHPETGHLFLLSSRDGLLLELDRSGRVLGTGKLPRSVARQPEGIAILPGGDLLIASEAAGKRALLLRFKPLTNDPNS